MVEHKQVQVERTLVAERKQAVDRRQEGTAEDKDLQDKDGTEAEAEVDTVVDKDCKLALGTHPYELYANLIKIPKFATRNRNDQSSSLRVHSDTYGKDIVQAGSG